MCCGPRVYSIQKRPTYKYKRHTRPRAVRTVRLSEGSRNGRVGSGRGTLSVHVNSRKISQRRDITAARLTRAGGGALLPPTPETYVGGRRAAAHRRGAPLRGRGVKGGHDGLRPLARGALRALAVSPLLLPGGGAAVQRADLCARRENRRSRRRDARAKAAVPAYP